MHFPLDIRALIIDMDGVLWHGTRALPGLQDFFRTLRSLHIPFMLATNNARQTPEQYALKLAQMGVTVSLEEILTSAMSTAFYLRDITDPETTKIFVIGESGARQALLEQGFDLTGEFDFTDPIPAGQNRDKADIVVCGLDKGLSWNKLAAATTHIRSGARFIATNADTSLPTEYGLLPGNGATLAALQATTGVSPLIIGKPEPIMYHQATRLLGVTPSETIVIGDRLDTDILGAVRADMRSIMVLSGVSSEKDLHLSEYQPTWVMPDIRAITLELQNLSKD